MCVHVHLCEDLVFVNFLSLENVPERIRFSLASWLVTLYVRIFFLPLSSKKAVKQCE